MKERVLITDAQMRSSLAIIRSLGKKGIEVTGAEETKFAPGLYSKFCKYKYIYPSPKDEKQFINSLLKKIKDNSYNVIFPVADLAIKAIINYEKLISKYTKIALPTNEIFIKGFDKAITLDIARKNKILHPKTFTVNNTEDIYNIREELDYPLVIKPRISFGSRGKVVCNSFSSLLKNFNLIRNIYGNVLIQDYIPYGGELGVYTLFNYDSEPRGLTVQKRLRSYPISGGPSTYRMTIKNKISDKCVNIAFRLLKAMKWSGIAMVEFRIDARDGIPKLMEVNPRFWGSLNLSILAGVNFPYLLYKLMIEGDIKPVLDYKKGIKCRWLLPGYLLWFFYSSKNITNLKKFLKLRTNYDIISIKDFKPIIGFFLATLRYAGDTDMWRFVIRR